MKQKKVINWIASLTLFLGNSALFADADNQTIGQKIDELHDKAKEKAKELSEKSNELAEKAKEKAEKAKEKGKKIVEILKE